MSQERGYQPRPGAEALRPPPNQGSSVRPGGETWPYHGARQAPPAEARVAGSGLCFMVSTDRRHIVVTGPGGYLTLGPATARSIGQMLIDAAGDIEREAGLKNAFAAR